MLDGWRSLPAPLRADLARGLPLALALAIALGAVVGIGAHYSNSFPSEEKPFGWPGRAGFENAVAMVRNDLVLAASVPALILGAIALRGLDPTLDRARRLAQSFATQSALLVLASLTGATLGSLLAARTPIEAWFAFSVAHALLALAFFALGFLWAAILRRHALAAAAATWLFFLAFYESLTRTILFRTVGYHELAAGHFPDWFWAAQAASPLSAYRGILILWRPDFRDFMEKATLDGAVLPAFLVPATFIGLMLALWVALPLALALGAWWWRSRATVPPRVPTAGGA